jgi:Ca-dependent carbohydrate-binding module xylan-binding
MTDVLNEHIIVEKWDDKAIYEITKLPTRCQLLKDGIPMKVKDTFTQADVRDGSLEISHNKCEGNKPVIDAFYFRIPLGDGSYLNAQTETGRSFCLPVSGTPTDGIFKFPITIFTQPSPQQIFNTYEILMEDQTKVVQRDDLLFSSDSDWIDWYLNRTDVPVFPISQTLSKWDRFAGTESYIRGNPGYNIPPNSDAYPWRWDGPDLGKTSIGYSKTSTDFNGIVSKDLVEYYTSDTRVWSDSTDDGINGLVISYQTVNGVPWTISAVRSGGFNGKAATATLTVELWGDYDDGSGGAPSFKIEAGSFTKTGKVTELTSVGQEGSQIFEYKVDASVITPSTPIKITYTNDYWTRNDKNLKVVSVKVNGVEASEYTTTNVRTGVTDTTDVPSTLGYVNSFVTATGDWPDASGGDPVRTWMIISTVGNTRTILADGSALAPNLKGNIASQGWNELGATQIQIVRKGNVVEATCSQFYGSQPNGTSDPSAVLDLDPSTKLTINLPSAFTGPKQFGMCSLSQALSYFSDMHFKVLPFPVPPVIPDPKDSDPMWERFPVLYTVTSVSDGTLANFLYDGVPMEAGQTFTNRDILDGRLTVKGLFAGGGRDVSFNFRVCAGDVQCKCSNGTYRVFIKEWPWPSIRSNRLYTVECSTQTVPHENMEFFVNEIGASTPSQISITFDSAKTDPNNLIEIVPKRFTQADIDNGSVSMIHHCVDGPLTRSETLWFTVCTQHNKCKSFPVYVNIAPLPIVVPPLDPGISVTPALCTFARNFTGDGMKQVGQCGTWAIIYGRIVPPPTTPGEILHIPNAGDGPITLVTIVDNNGVPEWQQLPINIPTADQSQCPPLEVAPNTDRSNSYIELNVWGDYGDRAPFFDLYAGKTLIDSNIKVDRLKTAGQPGSQKYGYNVKTSVLGNGPVRIVYTGNETSGPDINLIVNSITVNGKKFTLGNGLQLKSNYASSGKLMAQFDEAYTPIGPYPPAPYIGKGMQCFYDRKGQQWVSDKDGVWYPVENPPGSPLPDWTPLIKTDDYLIGTDTLDLPDLANPVYHKPTSTVFTEVKNEVPILSDNPYTKIANIDQFLWIGANEFWIPNGARFSLYFASNRFNTRFDIEGNLGTSLIPATDQLIFDTANAGQRSVLRINQNSKTDIVKVNEWKGTRYIREAMGSYFGPTDGSRIRQVYPHETAFDPDKAYNPVQQPAESLGSYLTRIPGTQSLGAFASAIRPVRIPQNQTLKINNPDTKAKNVVMWKEDPTTIYSYSGYNDPAGFKQQAAGSYDPTGNYVYPTYGNQYGTIEFERHFNSYKKYTNLNYKPPKQILGWVTAQYMFLDWYSINGPHEKRQGGAYDGTPPSNFDYYFNVRAFDAMTGESKVRRFAVHWNAKGLNPKTKKASAITDSVAYWSGDPSIDPPPSGTAICQFDDNGAIGSCTFQGNFTPGKY